ncbi:MAG: anti-sigma factor [Proteobacteria bacterium]|nr:anti-sigma factor [Pseudomonadota bacterium]
MNQTKQFVSTHAPLSADGPWIPEGPGKWSRPLRFLSANRGWVELMRLSPGVKLGVHRHTGEVHAYNLEGQRRLCTGEVVVPGDYVHESAGNVDWWEAVGDQPLVVLVTVMGAVEYLGPHGAVERRITTADRIADYRRWCEETGAQPRELVES